jgi:hypothetical protein
MSIRFVQLLGLADLPSAMVCGPRLTAAFPIALFAASRVGGWWGYLVSILRLRR